VGEQGSAERRLSPRFPPRDGTRVGCRRGTIGLGRDLALSVVELSETGLRLLLNEPLEHGQMVEVTLSPPGGGPEVRRLGLVMWARGDRDGECQAGVQFSERLSPEALRDLCQLPEG